MTIETTEEFKKATEELEALAQSYALPSDTPGYEDVWLPPDDTVRMWSVPRTTALYLQQFVEEHKPQSILELGTSSGYSTLFMASAARTYGGTVTSIEMAQPKIDIAQKYISQVGFEKDIQIIHGSIDEVLKDWSQKIDLVFLDADKMNYRAYIEQLEPHLNEGAVVIADNAIDFAHLMPDFLSYMQEGGGYESEMLELDNGLLISYRK